MSLINDNPPVWAPDDESRSPSGAFTAALLAKPVAPLTNDTTCGQVSEIFAGDLNLVALAIVDDASTPIGLIPRERFLSIIAKPLMADLYKRRPVHLLMERSPLIVDIDTPLGELSQMIARDNPTALADGFIITDNGLYHGIGTALDLMSTSVAVAELRAWQCETAQREAETASRAKTAFLANASHEIRTPLNAIMGFAELIRSEAMGPLGNHLYREYAADIVDSGQHLMELINDLLDLSKAEADRLELEEEMVEVPRLVVACARLLKERAAHHKVTLIDRVSRALPPVMGDQRKIRQMILNLLSNAVKYTPSGGTVTVASEIDSQGALRLSVRDDGVGMTPEEQLQALEPWGRVRHALNRRIVGTGLGLPLTKRLIELHGGHLLMRSAPGMGTTMTLVFPVARLAHPPRPAS